MESCRLVFGGATVVVTLSSARGAADLRLIAQGLLHVAALSEQVTKLTRPVRPTRKKRTS